MGTNGEKLTKGSDLSSELLIQKLGSITGVSIKRMFGGYGIFHDSKMFGLVDSNGQAFLKADDSIKHYFEEKGSHRHSRMPYYSIPGDILSDTDSLVIWAGRSIDLSKQ